MTVKRQISGIHHITAIASSASENYQFYETVLGLRLVKQTVNFDDPYTYHLYYGDEQGSPGTIITFFPWENLPSGKAGAGMVTAIAFSIPPGSVDYWRSRLNFNEIRTESTRRFGATTLQFKDPHGLHLELIEIPDLNPVIHRKNHSKPDGNSILGFHSATSLLKSLAETQTVLAEFMGMVLHEKEGNRYRFKMRSDNSLGRFYDVVIDPAAESGKPGGGTVHHIAFRTPTDNEQKYWQATLKDNGIPVTPVRDRKYFKSIYFNEPGGILFEIATDPPGFTVDESGEQLGRNLKLPDQYESMRSSIENRLQPLYLER